MRRASRFKYKDYRIEGPGRYKTMTLEPGEFIRRFMLHVLPKGFPSHPALRPAGAQPNQSRDAGARPRADRRSDAGADLCNRRRSSRLTIARRGQRSRRIPARAAALAW